MIKKVREFCEMGTGGTPRRSIQAYYGGKIPWVKSGEVNLRYVYDSEEKLTEEGMKNSNVTFLPPNTVLVAMYGATAGKVALLKIRATTNQAICALVPDPGVAHYSYLQYALEYLAPRLVSQTVGTGQPNLSQQIIGDLRVPIPSLTHQRKIVDILSRADRLKQTRKQSNQLTSKLIQSVFLKTFGDLLESRSHHELLLKDISKEIVVSFVGTVSKFYCSREEGIPFLRTKNILENRIVLDDLKYVRPEFHSQNKKSQITPGDLLMTRVGIMGRCALFPESLKEAHGGNIIIIRLKDSVNRVFVERMLNTPFVHNQIIHDRVGGIQSVFNTERARNLRIILPPKIIQDEFASKVHDINAIAERQMRSTAELNELFQSLIHKAFRGELRIASDEVKNEQSMKFHESSVEGQSTLTDYIINSEDVTKSLE